MLAKMTEYQKKKTHHDKTLSGTEIGLKPFMSFYLKKRTSLWIYIVIKYIKWN